MSTENQGEVPSSGEDGRAQLMADRTGPAIAVGNGIGVMGKR